MNKKAVVVNSDNVYKGKWVSINKVNIIKPDGAKAEHEVAIRPDCVLMLALKKDKICFVRQFRYPASEYLWEFPTGFINMNEEPKDAAIREFTEEVGLKPLKVKQVGEYWTWPGFSTQKVYVFLLSNFVRSKRKLDDTESDLRYKFVKLDTLPKMVKDGHIRSSSSLAALNYLI